MTRVVALVRCVKNDITEPFSASCLSTQVFSKRSKAAYVQEHDGAVANVTFWQQFVALLEPLANCSWHVACKLHRVTNGHEGPLEKPAGS